MSYSPPRLTTCFAVLTIALTGCSNLPQAKNGWSSVDQPDYTVPMNIARVHEKQGDLLKARETYQKLYALSPDNVEVCHRLMVVNLRLDDYAAADAMFAKAKTLAPRNAEILTDYGYSLYLRGQLTEAEQLLQAARQIKPRDSRIATNLGLTVGALGRIDEAMSLFRGVGTEAEALANLGFVHTQRHEFAQAKRCYSEALNLDPSLKPVQHALLQIAEKEKKFQRTANDPSVLTTQKSQRTRYGNTMPVPTRAATEFTQTAARTLQPDLQAPANATLTGGRSAQRVQVLPAKVAATHQNPKTTDHVQVAFAIDDQPVSPIQQVAYQQQTVLTSERSTHAVKTSREVGQSSVEPNSAAPAGWWNEQQTKTADINSVPQAPAVKQPQHQPLSTPASPLPSHIVQQARPLTSEQIRAKNSATLQPGQSPRQPVASTGTASVSQASSELPREDENTFVVTTSSNSRNSASQVARPATQSRRSAAPGWGQNQSHSNAVDPWQAQPRSNQGRWTSR